ncbi:hypothetical protein J6590_028234, partial [Homalodisca vitripennis]
MGLRRQTNKNSQLDKSNEDTEVKTPREERLGMLLGRYLGVTLLVQPARNFVTSVSDIPSFDVATYAEMNPWVQLKISALAVNPQHLHVNNSALANYTLHSRYISTYRAVA